MYRLPLIRELISLCGARVLICRNHRARMLGPAETRSGPQGLTQQRYSRLVILPADPVTAGTSLQGLTGARALPWIASMHNSDITAITDLWIERPSGLCVSHLTSARSGTSSHAASARPTPGPVAASSRADESLQSLARDTRSRLDQLDVLQPRPGRLCA